MVGLTRVGALLARRYTTVVSHYRGRGKRDALRVTVSRSRREVADWLQRHVVDESRSVVGLDAEWTPTFKAGAAPNKVALVQIATPTDVLLVQCSRMREFPSALALLIQDCGCIKTGVGIYEDLRRTCRDYGFSLEQGAFVDLALTAKRQAVQAESFSLAGLTQALLATKLSKSRRVQMSNWEARILTRGQIAYAAWDALVGLDMYKALEAQGAFDFTVVPSPLRNVNPISGDAKARDLKKMMGLASPAASRNDFKRLWLKGSESSHFLSEAALLLREADRQLLAEVEEVGPHLLESIETRKGSSEKFPSQVTFRTLLKILLSRFSLSFGLRLAGSPESPRDVKENIKSCEVLVFVGNSQAQDGEFASGFGITRSAASEAACFSLCKELLRLQQTMPELEWITLCAGKAPNHSVSEARARLQGQITKFRRETAAHQSERCGDDEEGPGERREGA